MKALGARLFQAAFQELLLSAGVLLRDFSLLPSQITLALASATITRTFWLRFFGLRDVGYLSTLVARRVRHDNAAWLFLAVLLGLTATRVFLLGYPVERGWEVLCPKALNGALWALPYLAPLARLRDFLRFDIRHNGMETNRYKRFLRNQVKLPDET